MSNICLGNLLPSSVLAYDNIDLIPNGIIPEVGTTARPLRKNAGQGVISVKETIRLLPASRLYAEFWFGVTTRVTGTNLGDLGQGAFQALGFLGLGSGAVIGGAIACSLTGDSEQTKSKFVFHLCDSETRLNREVTLTAEHIATGQIKLPDYIMGVLGVTPSPIVFVTPSVPLTQKQIAQAKAKTADEVQAILGRRVSPDQLTDSDMRLLLGIQDLNELENLGNSQRAMRGWGTTSEGQIQATFKNFSYSDPSNLFLNIVRDIRKNRYRADNEYERDDGHVFWNGSTDDLTDDTIKFGLFMVDPKDETKSVKLKVGDKVYISYVAVTRNIFRHAIMNVTKFFLFPDQSVYQMPPLDLVKGWNFQVFKFKSRKNTEQRTSLADQSHDDAIQKQIDDIQNSTVFTAAEKTKRIANLQNSLLLDELTCQRLVESKLERANRNPTIIGCYFADSRGIMKYAFRNGGFPETVLPRASIRDQTWFDDFLKSQQTAFPASFDDQGQIDLSKANNFFGDFLFDISDTVNSVCYDNEKYGYEKGFANAISSCSIFNKLDPESGIGIPNLDLVLNGLKGRENYDLTSAKFVSVQMQGASNLFTCNTVFTYDFGFCTKGTIQSNMLLRTPFFFDRFSKKTRIYVEQFSPQYPLVRDAGIFVGTTSAFQDNYAITTNPRENLGCLVYPDTEKGTVNYRVFEESIFNKNLSNLSYKLPTEVKPLPSIDNTLTENSIKFTGYDNVLGSQPGYYKGTEITTESGLMTMNKLPSTMIISNKLSFSVDGTTKRINVSVPSGKRIRKLIVKYKPNSKTFLDEKNRLLSFVFPNSKTVIDNVALPYEGVYSTKERLFTLDTRYINGENFFIDGDILKKLDITSIESESIVEEEYQKYKISSSVVSTCFDPSGNWFVFYEDPNASLGETKVDGKDAEGTFLVGPVVPNSRPGLSSGNDTEISCLISPDYGETWFNYAAIVRTAVGDTVRYPYALTDYNKNIIHLFFILNDNLMHKVIDTSLFKYEDAFLGYKRPNSITENTEKSYGLYHFSNDGIKLRESPSSVVIGNLTGEYLVKQLAITDAMQKNNRTDYRFFCAGDRTNYVEGFANVDFVSYKDSSGQLKVLFAQNGKFFVRASPDSGFSWFDLIKDGMHIHQNTNTQEIKSITNLGLAVDRNSKSSYLTYQSDGMLFLRRFESGISIEKNYDISNVLSPTSEKSKPVFIIGNMTQEVKTAITNKTSLVLFPYDDVNIFGDSYAISEIPSLGYATSTGSLRFFYKDSSGAFRAFSYGGFPTLDVGFTQGSN